MHVSVIDSFCQSSALGLLLSLFGEFQICARNHLSCRNISRPGTNQYTTILNQNRSAENVLFFFPLKFRLYLKALSLSSSFLSVIVIIQFRHNCTLTTFNISFLRLRQLTDTKVILLMYLMHLTHIENVHLI